MTSLFIDRKRGTPPFGRDHDSYPPICLDVNHFLISREDFYALPEYSTSRPTGVYDGKCWKALNRSSGEWWIGCYLEEDPPHPDGLLTPFRLALIVE